MISITLQVLNQNLKNKVADCMICAEKISKCRNQNHNTRYRVKFKDHKYIFFCIDLILFLVISIENDEFIKLHEVMLGKEGQGYAPCGQCGKSHRKIQYFNAEGRKDLW